MFSTPSLAFVYTTVAAAGDCGGGATAAHRRQRASAVFFFPEFAAGTAAAAAAAATSAQRSTAQPQRAATEFPLARQQAAGARLTHAGLGRGSPEINLLKNSRLFLFRETRCAARGSPLRTPPVLPEDST